jgi:hypothetical protein
VAPDHVYAYISDLTSTGAYSPECTQVEWLEGATGPTVGSRFVGYNRAGPFSWTREGRIVIARPGEEFSFMVEWHDRDSTLWRFRLEPAGKGTLLTESYELQWSPWWMRSIDAVTLRRPQLARNVRRSLRRIKQHLEAQRGEP